MYKTSDTEDIELSMFNKIGCVGESSSWTPTNILTHNVYNGCISGETTHFNKTTAVSNSYDPGTYWYNN